MKSFFSPVLFAILTTTTAFCNTDPALNQHQKDVISYFKEVALGFEYGKASGLTRKWKTPMKLFVEGNTSANVLHELDLVIAELNSLATDGFSIARVDCKELSNMHMFFGTRQEFLGLYPNEKETVAKSSGIFRIFWTKSNHITKGYIFIHTQVSEREQRHAVREELTQALGLGKDSPKYLESIFQSRWTLPTQFSDIDRDLIRFLYHPSMIVGMTGDEADRVLTEIFLSELTPDSPLPLVAAQTVSVE